MKIYFDTCSLSRLHDASLQARIREEANAVARLLSADIVWIGSDMLSDEVLAISDEEKRGSILAMMVRVNENVEVTPGILSRAGKLAALGFGKQDAIHLACAEFASADCLLTTDDRFFRLAKRCAAELRVAVENPSYWVIRFAANEY